MAFEIPIRHGDAHRVVRENEDQLVEHQDPDDPNAVAARKETIDVFVRHLPRTGIDS